ncbi:MAG: Ig-like domain-containing protein [Lachnospiraceae bacterium]|nr:Ig-like domain-containing protein [Lachnospiraceae bacterium]
MSLKVKETAQLTATLSSDTTATFTWSNSDDKIATVDTTGKVTAIAKGTAVITVVTKDGSYSATCTVTVTESGSGIDNPEPDPTNNNTLVVKQKISIVDRFDAETPYKKYNVAPKGVAAVTSKGILTAKKPAEEVIITGLIKDGKVWKEAESITVKIEAPAIKQKTITATKAEAIINAADNITGTTISPTTWISSKPAVAEIDAQTGIITTKGKGTTKITAVYGEGKYAAKYTFSVKVSIPVMSKAKATMLTGATLKLKLKNVSNDRMAEIQWASSDENVAEVDSTGKVTVLSYSEETAGKVVITATIDEVPYSCEIMVKKPEIKKSSLVIKQGKNGKVALKTTKLKNIQWTSSDEKVVTVDEKGKVTGIAPGTALIQTTAGGVTNTCEVTVR